jgi:hemerythrin-like domain-containing protein
LKQTIDFRTPESGFGEPLALWSACHVRVIRMAGLLERVREALLAHGIDHSVRVTATSIRRYFNEAAPRHHADEEIDLFPLLPRRLAESMQPKADDRIAAAIAALSGDHTSLDTHWRRLDTALAAIELGEPVDLEEDTVARFAGGYRRHCETEETIIKPALQSLLTAHDRDAIGHSMARRRGLDWDALRARPN